MNERPVAAGGETMAVRSVVRLGFVTPSSNTALEPEAWSLVSDLQTAASISLHVSRVRVTKIAADTASSAQFDMAPMKVAGELLGDARVDAVAWAGTSGSWLGIDHDLQLCQVLSQATGGPATTSTLAMLSACEALGAQRVALVTPYTADIVERICNVYEARGLTIVGEAHLGITENWAFGQVGSDELGGLVDRAAKGKPDAVLIVCTNLRASTLAAVLEDRTGAPLVDSTFATVWHALLLAGRPIAVTGHGRLLEVGSRQASRLSKWDISSQGFRKDVP